MRIRSTKPEFWRSRRIAEVDWEARFILKGLESYVDDNGVGKDDLELIVGDLFSRDLVRDPSGTLKRVQEAIQRLHAAGLVHRYSDDGTDLLFVAFWESVQYINRPTKGRFRRPDGTFNYGESQIGSSLKSPQEDSRGFSAGSGDQGIRGSGDTATPDADAPRAELVVITDAQPAAPSAQTLVAEWIDHCAERPPGNVIGQVSKQIKTMLNEGIAHERIRVALAEWNRKGLHPSTLPSIVHEQANRRPVSRKGDIDWAAAFDRAAARDAQNGASQ